MRLTDEHVIKLHETRDALESAMTNALLLPPGQEVYRLRKELAKPLSWVSYILALHQTENDTG